MDTIFAESTAVGRAGVAVVRVSGPAVPAILHALIGRVPPPRLARLATLWDTAPESAEASAGDNGKNPLMIDKGLVLYFPAPNSFTGEDVAELQVHGSRAVLAALARALARLGARLATPGEFTRRAFANGKLDLAAVEGLADLLQAETEAQRRAALHQLDGGLSRQIAEWQQQILQILAQFEAAIDFVDEESIPPDLAARQQQTMHALAATLQAAAADSWRGERLRSGLQVAIMGEPNAGKSTLLNALARREVAIVSAVPGTTRDVLEVALDLGGYPLVVADTAGLRQSDDTIEQMGMARAAARANAADLVLVLLDATRPVAAQQAALAPYVPANKPIWWLLNKTDLASAPPDWPSADLSDAAKYFVLAAATGAGLPPLLQALGEAAGQLLANPPSLNRERHLALAAEAASLLQRAATGQAAGQSVELVAEDLRLSLRALGRLLGQVDTEAVLDIIFRDFCLGK